MAEYTTKVSNVNNEVYINDIYEVFKTYWNAKDLTYASITDDSYNAKGNVDISNAGQRNGMWFGSSKKVQSYKFEDGKTGKPINCSTLANLVMLGIPYEESKYNNDLTSYFVPEMSNIKSSFNLYGDDIKIDKSNYKAYFITPRMLDRFTEMGLEIPALRYEWKPKSTATSRSKWIDFIGVTSDLNEARIGDIIFWNTHDKSEFDPREVSHCCIVLDRLSYNSTNTNQPLLLLAEATRTLGVQVSYYIYDTTERKGVTGTFEHRVPKYICRPVYRALSSEHSKPDDDVDYNAVVNSNGLFIKINPKLGQENTKELYTIIFDWIPVDDSSYLSIANPDNISKSIKHYLPNTIANTTYNKVKIIVPINTSFDTSKGRVITMQTDIAIQECYNESDVNKNINISNIKIYKGII